jgi:hypothetical protein
MRIIVTVFFIIAAFSWLTIYELIQLKKHGFDVIARLRVTQASGDKFKFFFEAFGVVAFVIFQPIALTCLLVWAAKSLDPQWTSNILNMLSGDSLKKSLKP